jgi:hypothetical protein
MALALRVVGLDADGVRLISPASPGFDDLARPLMGERIAPVGLQLKPMLAIVSNENPQTIVSQSIVWRVTYADGRTSTTWSHTSFPETVCGDVQVSRNPAAIASGRRYLEACGLVLHGYGTLDDYYDQFLGQFVDRKNEELAGAIELGISVDAVIFEDGRLAGPDEGSRLADLFSAYVRAKQGWYRGILTALEAGRSVEEAFAALDAFLDEQSREMRAGRMVSHFNDPDALWRQQAAAEASGWRRKFRNEEIPDLLKTTIRLEPFVVHR